MLNFTRTFLTLQAVLGVQYTFEKEIEEQRTSWDAETEICVSGQNFDSIDVDCLCENFPAITSLIISDTNITEIPSSLEKLEKLKKFKFKNYNPDIIVDYSNLAQMRNLEELILIDQTLTYFPLEISELKSLTSLYLCESKLKLLPPDIGKLSSLKTLNLAITS